MSYRMQFKAQAGDSAESCAYEQARGRSVQRLDKVGPDRLYTRWTRLWQIPLDPLQHLFLPAALTHSHLQVDVAHPSSRGEAGQGAVVFRRRLLLQHDIVGRRGQLPEIVLVGAQEKGARVAGFADGPGVADGLFVSDGVAFRII